MDQRKRLNPNTNKLFKAGDTREDGFIFSKYRTDRIKQNGYFGEKWLSPDVYAKELANKNKYRLTNHEASLRRAKDLNRLPVWLSKEDKQQIKRFYEMAKKATLETGILHHVDHVIPLKGDLVSGLHTPLNLKVVPANENLKKANNF